MTVTAQSGAFGFALQNAKTTDAGYTAPTTIYWHRATDIDLGIGDDVRLMPGEVGGVPVPSGAYKGGVIPSGGAVLNPRLEDDFGHLLKAVMGDCVTSTGENNAGATVAGVNSHEFGFATQTSFIPYVQFRKLIPNDVAADELGEIYRDCKVLGLTFNIPNDGLISVRLDAMGRDFQLVPDPRNAATPWAPAFEDFDTIPISVDPGSSITIPDIPNAGILSCTVAMMNEPLDVRMEKIVGSPYLDDITVVNRSMSFDLMVKWKDPDLYRAMLTGTASGTTWAASVFTSSISIVASAPEVIGATAEKYALQIDAPRVLFQQAGGVRLSAGGALIQRLTGVAIAPTSGSYATIKLQNAATSY